MKLLSPTLNQKIILSKIIGTLRFINKEVKFKGTGFMVSALLFFNSHNFGNFHPNEKNKISKS